MPEVSSRALWLDHGAVTLGGRLRDGNDRSGHGRWATADAAVAAGLALGTDGLAVGARRRRPVLARAGVPGTTSRLSVALVLADAVDHDACARSPQRGIGHGSRP